MLSIDQVVETTLVAIYANDLLGRHLFLKGGQALRLAHGLDNRFSRDADFSTPSKIPEEGHFFEEFNSSLTDEFANDNFHLFDFKYSPKPRKRPEAMPDFWNGWAIEFKLIEDRKRDLPIGRRRREALIPEGSESSKVKIDISEYEYCDSIEIIKVKSVDVKIYSRVLLILEKIRAICQQHPDYPLRTTPTDRSRDYYDIERLYTKILKEGKKDRFIAEGKKHLKKVFEAKEVSFDLLDKIFEESFINLQKNGWQGTRLTIKGDIEEFDYYVETVREIVAGLGNGELGA